MRRLLWLLALVAVIAGLAGFQQFSSWSLTSPKGNSKGESEEASKAASATPSRGRSQGASGRSGAVPVTVATVVQKNLPVQIDATGSVEAYSTVAIRAQAGGVVTKVHFAQGQDVKQGEALFTIDPRPFESA